MKKLICLVLAMIFLVSANIACASHGTDPGNKPAEGQAVVFSDVGPGKYYSKAVSVLADMGIVSGVGQNKFAPDAVTTRAMMTEILYRINAKFGRTSADAGKPAGNEPFTDVEGKWYSGSADWARLAGVVRGYPDGSFRGDSPITRAEAATILYRYLESEKLGADAIESTSPSPFLDKKKIPSWAKEAVDSLYRKGIMIGVATYFFEPDTQMDRAMIATVAYRVVLMYQMAGESSTEGPDSILKENGLSLGVGAWRDYMPVATNPENPLPENYNCLFVVRMERIPPTGEEMPDIKVSAEIDGHKYTLKRDVTGLKDYSSYRISMEDRKYLGDGYLPDAIISVKLTLTLDGKKEIKNYILKIGRTD